MNELQKENNKTTNKKVLKWVGIAVVVLIFMGMCGALVGGDSEPSTPAQSQTQSAQDINGLGAVTPTKKPAEKPLTAEQKLDARFDAAWAGMDTSMSAKQGRNNAKLVCTRLDNGDGINVIFADLLDLTGDAQTAGYILGGAAYAYCPEHKDLIEALGG